MGLPIQVQKQAEAAEQYDKMVADAQPAEAQPAETGSEAQPPAEEQTNPEVAVSEIDELRKKVEQLAFQLNDENNPTFKQRWTSLQGMYNSQVPQLQQQVKQLSEQLAQVSTQQQTAKPEQVDNPLVTKTDVEAFGEDLIDVIRRGAREEIQRQAAAYEEKITALKAELQAARQDVGQVVQTQVHSQQEQFFAGLNASIPKWQEIQATTECQEFLASPVPGTRTEWNTVLLDAANSADLPRVLQVFEQFFARHPKYSPKAKATPRPQPNRSELERQVAPSKAGAAPSLAESKRVYTGSEYEVESMKMVRLAQAGRHDEATRLEAELNAALAEGRVR